MLDITAIILTYNEEIHIGRCLENVNRVAARVYVVDCFSTDRTAEIAENKGGIVVKHAWPGNQAEQFNWALDNLAIDTKWILRLDADEYLLPELIAELEEKLPLLPNSVSAVSLPLARAFCGRMLKHGIVNDIRIVRIFRKGCARYEKRLMDEHLVILSGTTFAMNHPFIDDNRMPITRFIDKHNEYASREAALLLDAEYGLSDADCSPCEYGEEVKKKRNQKDKYAKMPLFWRSLGYFVYRYFFKLGFLDGNEGFLWDFLQGLWYRILIDAKILEVKRACGSDPDKIRAYLKEHLNVDLSASDK